MKVFPSLLLALALLLFGDQAKAQLFCPGSANALGQASLPITSLPYTVSASDICLMKVFNSATPGTVKLTSVSPGSNFPLYMWNEGAGTVTLQPQASDQGKTALINGSATITLVQGQGAYLSIGGDGNWYANAPVPIGTGSVPFSPSTAYNWSALQTFSGGISTGTATINGYQSSGTNLASGGNFFIGGSGSEAAGGSWLSGNENTYVGDKAGSQVTTGQFNTALGHNALGDGGGCAITGSNNTAIGTDALRNFCGNSAVTAVGSAALKNQTNSSVNNITAVGASAGLNENNGNSSNNSTLVGNGAGSGQVGASYRQITALGANAGANLTTANNDTLVGVNAASATLTNGTGNIIIASGARTVDTVASGSTGEINVENAIVGYSAGNAPTIASGFAASGSTISTPGGTFHFSVTVGSTTPGSTGTITMPTAPTGWDCEANDITTTSTSVFLTKQTGGSATTVVLTNYSNLSVATAWAASDVINVRCLAY